MRLVVPRAAQHLNKAITFVHQVGYLFHAIFIRYKFDTIDNLKHVVYEIYNR
jgi:hypothetical protein